MAGRKRLGQGRPVADSVINSSAPQRGLGRTGKPVSSWKPAGKRQRTVQCPGELQSGFQPAFPPFPAVLQPSGPSQGIGGKVPYAVEPVAKPQLPEAAPPVPRPAAPRAPYNSNTFLLRHKTRKRGRRTLRGRRAPAGAGCETPVCSTPASLHTRATPRRSRQDLRTLVTNAKIDEFGSAGGLLQPADTDSDDEDVPRIPVQTQAAQIKDLELANATLRKEVEYLRSRLSQVETMETSPGTSTALTATEVDKS